MSRSLLTLFILIVCFQLRSQNVLESDSIKGQAIFYVPGITTAQLNNIKNEFANYPDIQKAVFVYQNHNCLVVEMADVANSRIVYYRDLLKIVAGYAGADNVTIKTSQAYSAIMADNNDSSFILK